VSAVVTADPAEIAAPRAGRLPGKDLLGLEGMSARHLELVLDTAESFKEVSQRAIKKVPALRGRTVVSMFYEPSTRTRVSFELAAKRLSADVMGFSKVTSSVSKGESLLDTTRNIEAMNVDLIILRHQSSGAARYLAERVEAGVVNAGDGIHEHPTQALLDMFTIRERKGRIADLHVAIVGDILHSRVARSNVFGLLTLGAKVTLVGPSTLIPPEMRSLGVEVSHRLDEVMPEVDVVNVLRIQRERQEEGLFPSLREYARLFGVNSERLARAKEDVLIMHPGPINRGVEISVDVADGPYSVVLDQVTNGVAVRMAVLYLLLSGVEEARDEMAP
jgi:aspartate carbamoyltransferase catalytic subunit